MAQGKLQPTLHLVPEEASQTLLALPPLGTFERILRRVLAEVVNLPTLREVVHNFFAALHDGLFFATVLATPALASALFLAAVFSAAMNLGVLCHLIFSLRGIKNASNVFGSFEAARSRQ